MENGRQRRNQCARCSPVVCARRISPGADPFEIAVTNPSRREDALHMDDGADLTSIIRLKPLKSRGRGGGSAQEKRGRPGAEGAGERTTRRAFASPGMHNWINLNCNESTVPDESAMRFTPAYIRGDSLVPECPGVGLRRRAANAWIPPRVQSAA